MTVSSTQSYVEYNGNGSTTTFTIPFYFLLSDDISAMVADADGNVTELVNNTDFSVTGSGISSGGTITFSTAYASEMTILIYRNPPATQETKYYENGKFPAVSHEAALDKLTMLIQEHGWQLSSLFMKKPNIFAVFFDAEGNRIKNLGDPIDDGDAVNKRYFGDKIDSAVAEEAAERKAADEKIISDLNNEVKARQDADANLQEQLTGNVPLESSAFSVISWHKQEVDNSVTIPEKMNAWSFGPRITIADGQLVTIGDGSYWTIANGQQSDSAATNIDFGTI